MQPNSLIVYKKTKKAEKIDNQKAIEYHKTKSIWGRPEIG